MRNYTDKPTYADYGAPEKFKEIERIVAEQLKRHPNAICSYSGGSGSDVLIDIIEGVRRKFSLAPVKYMFIDTELEMEKMRKACTNRNGLNKKHLAIVEVLYSTGCRVGELVGMNRDDVQGDRILVLGKGNKERWVYLNARAQMALQDYLDTRTDNFPAMFIGENIVTKEKTERLDKDTVGQIVRNLGKRAGVEGAHPHRFRRTAATVALKRGMPIEQVSKMLGHEQLTTTQIYISIDDEEVHSSHMKYLT